MAVRRYDQSEPATVTTTPAGGRRLSANLTRVGVFEYRYADGTKVREYRPPSEVLSPTSIKSLRGATVTDLHPDGPVTPSNFREVSRGHVVDAAPAGDHVDGVLDINDAELIALIDAGERCEVSCGYTADFDPTPGVTPEGEHYDGVQRDIDMNHVAVGPKGWGRQGPTVALRLDSTSAIASCMTVASASPSRDVPPKKAPIMAMTKIDGIDYEVGSASHFSAIEKQTKALTERADSADVSAKAEKARADAAEKLMNDEAAKLVAEKARADAAELAAAPKALAARINERVRLVVLARKVLGSTYLADADGAPPGDAMAAASDDDIIKAVLAKSCPGLDTKLMDHSMLMGALMATSSAAADDEMAEVDSIQEPGGAPPGDASLGDMNPNSEKGLGAYDSRFAPRGKIGERVKNPNFTDADDVSAEPTQEDVLRKQAVERRDSWRKPLPGAAIRR